MKLILSLILLITLPAYAGGKHDYTPPEPVPVVSDNDPNTGKHLFIFTAIILTVWCLSEKCWKEEPVIESTMTPEIPRNEYTYTIKP